MSTIRLTYILCDGNSPHCWSPGEPANNDVHETETAEMPRPTLREQGWINRGGKDYCPGCAAHMGIGRRTRRKGTKHA